MNLQRYDYGSEGLYPSPTGPVVLVADLIAALGAVPEQAERKAPHSGSPFCYTRRDWEDYSRSLMGVPPRVEADDWGDQYTTRTGVGQQQGFAQTTGPTVEPPATFVGGESGFCTNPIVQFESGLCKEPAAQKLDSGVCIGGFNYGWANNPNPTEGPNPSLVRPPAPKPLPTHPMGPVVTVNLSNKEPKP